MQQAKLPCWKLHKTYYTLLLDLFNWKRLGTSQQNKICVIAEALNVLSYAYLEKTTIAEQNMSATMFY